jgi:hypothetical protein
MEDNWTGGTNNPPTNGWDYANSTNSSYLNDNIWHNVVSVRENDTTRIYIDGVLQNTSYTTLIPNFNGSSVIIGASNASSQFFKGSIDEIGIWNRALSPLELSSLNYGCPYSITSQPANQSGSIGETKSFTLIHSGSAINYQWQSNPIGCGWQNLSNINQYTGAQTNALSVSSLSYPNHNQPFRIISKYGECADTSSIVKIILTNIAKDSLHLIQLKNDSITKSETISLLINDTTNKAKTIADLIADTTYKANTINLLINDTTNKANTIASLIADITKKANTISLLISDTANKANTIASLIADTTKKANTISFLISDTSNKAKTIADLIADTTDKGETIRQLETALANKHDTLYVASIISNDTLKISIHTGISPISPMLNSLKVYPNPASSYLIIDLEKPGYFIAKLTGISGQTTISQNSTTIDISGLANGIYILTIYDSNNKLLSTNKIAIIK